MQHKILIAEDDTDISRLLSRILEAQGYQALQAFSGTEALSLIEREEPDLLLLDLMLPGLSGEELLRKLREERRYSFPVLILSAKSALGDKVALLKSGADDYITKPFEPDRPNPGRPPAGGQRRQPFRAAAGCADLRQYKALSGLPQGAGK